MYENQRQGLGADLLLTVEATLEAIRRRPEMYPLAYREVRRALLKRFPYGIYFIVNGNKVAVIAVFHARRNPQVWQQRR